MTLRFTLTVWSPQSECPIHLNELCYIRVPCRPISPPNASCQTEICCVCVRSWILVGEANVHTHTRKQAHTVFKARVFNIDCIGKLSKIQKHHAGAFRCSLSIAHNLYSLLLSVWSGELKLKRNFTILYGTICCSLLFCILFLADKDTIQPLKSDKNYLTFARVKFFLFSCLAQ